MSRDLSELEFRVRDAGALSERERGALLGLFEMNYRRADPAFLAKSLAQLRNVATATPCSPSPGLPTPRGVGSRSGEGEGFSPQAVPVPDR